MIKPFDFYFDFVSPYSFLAHKEIRKIDIETGFTEVDKDLTEKFNVNGVTANLGNGVSFISSISSLNQQFEDEAAAASGAGGAGAT